MKVKSIQAHGVAIALLYALRRARRSSRVADVWVQASVAAASAHSKSLKEE